MYSKGEIMIILYIFQNRDNDHLKWNSLMIKTLCYTWLINPNIILYEYFRK